MTRFCGCCHLRHDSEEGRFIGPQEVGDGEWLMLHLCPGCTTTYTGAVVQDAARCDECTHLIVGDHEDPKLIVSTTENGIPRSRILCADCGLTDSDARDIVTVRDGREHLAMRFGVDLDGFAARRLAEARALRERGQRGLFLRASEVARAAAVSP